MQICFVNKEEHMYIDWVEWPDGKTFGSKLGRTGRSSAARSVGRNLGPDREPDNLIAAISVDVIHKILHLQQVYKICLTCQVQRKVVSTCLKSHVLKF